LGVAAPATYGTVRAIDQAGIITPLRGWLIFFVATHGLRRGLYSFAASRLPLFDARAEVRSLWLDDELDPISGGQF
jgi:hypothetical protein